MAYPALVADAVKPVRENHRIDAPRFRSVVEDDIGVFRMHGVAVGLVRVGRIPLYLLDTNVISEVRKGERADAGLRQWFAAVEADDLALSVLVVGEIRLGILRLHRYAHFG